MVRQFEHAGGIGRLGGYLEWVPASTGNGPGAPSELSSHNAVLLTRHGSRSALVYERSEPDDLPGGVLAEHYLRVYKEVAIFKSLR